MIQTCQRIGGLTLELLALVEIMRSEAVSEKSDAEQEWTDLEDSLECANCRKLTGISLFCGEFCRQLAEFIRYLRRSLADRRIENGDVQAAIGARLLMLTGGGYPREERRLTREQREHIFERDLHKCETCGAPATEIDHIHGNSNELSNLRALCGKCNRKEAFSKAVPPSPEAAARIEKMYLDIAIRVAAPTALRCCDNEELWKERFQPIMAARRARARELEEEAETAFEDVDGYLRHTMQKDD